MSFWGTGIKQSDEFMDVYDYFFELYKDDADAREIYRSILAEYQAECSDETTSPLLYTVYYALAYALWECGAKDEWLWQKIGDIIASDADLIFWDEPGAEPQLKKRRRKELQKFWSKLNSAPANIKKPKKTQTKRAPATLKGTLFAYACTDGYRAALVLDELWNSRLTAITEELFDHVPDETEAMHSHTHTVSWFSAREFIPKKDRILISQLHLAGNYNNRAGLLFSSSIVGISNVGKREFFFDPSSAAPSMERNHIARYQLNELSDPEILPPYHPRINVDLL